VSSGGSDRHGIRTLAGRERLRAVNTAASRESQMAFVANRRRKCSPRAAEEPNLADGRPSPAATDLPSPGSSRRHRIPCRRARCSASWRRSRSAYELGPGCSSRGEPCLPSALHRGLGCRTSAVVANFRGRILWRHRSSAGVRGLRLGRASPAHRRQGARPARPSNGADLVEQRAPILRAPPPKSL
jgi:hypothetical protein